MNELVENWVNEISERNMEDIYMLIVSIIYGTEAGGFHTEKWEHKWSVKCKYLKGYLILEGLHADSVFFKYLERKFGSNLDLNFLPTYALRRKK